MLAAIKKIMYYDVFSLDAIPLIANCETSFCYMGGLLPVPSGPAPRAWGTYQIVSQVYSPVRSKCTHRIVAHALDNQLSHVLYHISPEVDNRYVRSVIDSI